jgi:ribosomal protein S12 methylthiotransferase accessory factor
VQAQNIGAGVAALRARAMMKAVGESIERYCSASCPQQILVHARFDELGDTAIDPARLAVFARDQCNNETDGAAGNAGFSFPDSHIQLSWVDAHSLISGNKLKVPATFVYVPLADGSVPPEPRIWFPISTGLACGPSVAAATCKALLEVIERDAFAITWANELPCPKLSLEALNRPDVAAILEALSEGGLTCTAYALRTDMAIPVILVVITSEVPPYVSVGLGADLSASDAACSALEEATQTFLAMNRAARAALESEVSSLRNPQNLEQHALAYAVLPEFQAHLRFLDAQISSEPAPDLQSSPCSSVTDRLHAVIDALAARGHEALCVDVTTDDVRELDLAVVRAILPGFRHLDVDHTLRYFAPGRLFEVPVRLGLAARERSPAEINPNPHPFP